MTNDEFSKKTNSINKGFLSTLFGSKRLQQSTGIIFALSGGTLYTQITEALGQPYFTSVLGESAGPIASTAVSGLVTLGLVYGALLVTERFSRRNIQLKEIEQIKSKVVTGPLSRQDAKELFEESKQLINEFAADVWNKGAASFENQTLIDRGVGLIKEMASHGEPSAQYHLGRMHLSGTCVEQDSVKAFKLLSASAQQGNTGAMFGIAEMYLDGEGVEPDYVVESGANHTVDDVFAGDPVRAIPNAKKGMAVLVAACQQGDPNALERMGYMYQKGLHGCEVDLGRAERCYERAVEQGSRSASVRLEFISGDEGQCQAFDSRSIKALEQKSADGDEDASFELIRAYSIGVEVERDLVKIATYTMALESDRNSDLNSMDAEIKDLEKTAHIVFDRENRPEQAFAAFFRSVGYSDEYQSMRERDAKHQDISAKHGMKLN